MASSGSSGGHRSHPKPYVYWRFSIRRGGRAVECGGLENRCGCKLTVGSNPTPSAAFIGVLALDRRARRLYHPPLGARLGPYERAAILPAPWDASKAKSRSLPVP